MSTSARLRLIVRLARPSDLVLAALTYALGAGAARYLGNDLRPLSLWVGLVWVLLLLFATHLLAACFQPADEPFLESESRRERARLRLMMLQLAVAALSVSAALTVLMLRDGRLTPPVLFFQALALILGLAYAIPPLRMKDRGFGELALAILLADFFPAIAFFLQAEEFHRLLAMVTTPLTALALAFFLATDFPSFATDLKYERHTMLTRLGWQRAIPLHHLLLVVAYLLFALAPLLAFPWSLLWPAFLTVPLAAYQVFMLRNIALGAKPVWRLLLLNGAAIFGLTAYSLTLTLWLR
ncbi:MAG: hypothetical protein D6770_08000 [Anaerolineae bacterium]|nr:MAG: hypothetical protein D6770_08000 [Anaerolineae bacterium]